MLDWAALNAVCVACPHGDMVPARPTSIIKSRTIVRIAVNGMTTLRFHARYPVQGSLSEVDGRRPTDFSQTALTLEEDRYTHDREYSMHPCSEKLHILPHEEEWRYPIYGVLSHGVRSPTTVRLYIIAVSRRNKICHYPLGTVA